MNILSTGRAVVITLWCITCAGCGKKAATPEPVITETAKPVPAVLPSSIKVEHNNITYVTTGLGVSESNRIAIINNEVYTIGAEVGPGIILKDIQLTYASLLVNDEEHLLRPKNLQRQLDLGKTVTTTNQMAE